MIGLRKQWRLLTSCIASMKRLDNTWTQAVPVVHAYLVWWLVGRGGRISDSISQPIALRDYESKATHTTTNGTGGTWN